MESPLSCHIIQFFPSNSGKLSISRTVCVTMSSAAKTATTTSSTCPFDNINHLIPFLAILRIYSWNEMKYDGMLIFLHETFNLVNYLLYLPLIPLSILIYAMGIIFYDFFLKDFKRLIIIFSAMRAWIYKCCNKS